MELTVVERPVKRRISRELKVNALSQFFYSGKSIKDICDILNVTRNTFYRWRKSWLTSRWSKPVNPTGRHRILSQADCNQLREYFERYPTATNADAVHFLEQKGLKLSKSSVSNYLKRFSFTRKLLTDQSVNYPNERVLNETRLFCQTISRIPNAHRVYVDESFAYTNEAPKYGRSIKGSRISRPRERHGDRFTIYFAIRLDGIVHKPLITKENANDVQFIKYVTEVLAPHVRAGDSVIWDRLGQAGRCKNPQKQHYNPTARAEIEKKGGTVLFLPPKGKYFNPIELAFAKMKSYIRNTYPASTAGQEGRPRTEIELCEVISEACQSITTEQIEGWFRERATTRAFANYYPQIMIE